MKSPPQGGLFLLVIPVEAGMMNWVDAEFGQQKTRREAGFSWKQ
jgi:hypothetical protein